MRTVTLFLVAAFASPAQAQPAAAPQPTPAARTPRKPVAAPKVRGAGDAPAITLFDAISRAKAYARKNHISFARQYLQSASFDVVERKWDLVWQTPNAKGGRTEIAVIEDGTFTVDYGE